jgi:L-ascorbate metabolism protein UlaG (beta-lactamase superfamily)
MSEALRIRYVGHATVRIEIDGTTLITDPVFRHRLLHLRRHGRRPDAAARAAVDATLLSHYHLDHADLRSLRELGRDVPLVGPPGAARLLGDKGFSRVEELPVGGTRELGSLTVTATRAEHDGRRWPLVGLGGETCGFVVAGSQKVYFAGDTDVFDEMEGLVADLDVAFLPVWGWGTSLGEGHMDPQRAARAAALLRPRVAIPVHWGTFFPFALHRRHGHLLRDPPHDFARETARVAPDVEVRVLEPGSATEVAAA